MVPGQPAGRLAIALWWIIISSVGKVIHHYSVLLNGSNWALLPTAVACKQREQCSSVGRSSALHSIWGGRNVCWAFTWTRSCFSSCISCKSKSVLQDEGEVTAQLFLISERCAGTVSVALCLNTWWLCYSVLGWLLILFIDITAGFSYFEGSCSE